MFKKLFALLGVLVMVGMSTPLVTTVYAALSAPASYDIKYTYSTDRFKLDAGGTVTTPGYTRTADSIYWNYTTTQTSANNAGLPSGLSITMTFKHSNTAWTLNGSVYEPTDIKIGSDNLVGTLDSKLYFLFLNNTFNDYYLSIDVSSSPSSVFYAILNNNQIIQDGYASGSTNVSNVNLITFYIPSFSQINLYTVSTVNARYFDAWYLKNLGTSTAYTQGASSGYNSGYNVGYSGAASSANISYNSYVSYASNSYASYVSSANNYYSSGISSAYQGGYNSGYGTGFTIGYQEGTLTVNGEAITASTMIVIGLVLTFLLMAVGFFTKRYIWNLLAVASSVFFITQTDGNIALIIVTFGLIVLNLAYTFYGLRED